MSQYAYFCYSARCTGHHKFNHSKAVQKESKNGICPDCFNAMVMRKINKTYKREPATHSKTKDKEVYAQQSRS